MLYVRVVNSRQSIFIDAMIIELFSRAKPFENINNTPIIVKREGNIVYIVNF